MKKTLLFEGPLTLLLLSAAGPAHAGSHVNQDVGYRIIIPEDFALIERADPVGLDDTLTITDRYVMDRFRGTKDIYTTAGPWPIRLFISTFYFPERSAAEIAQRRKEELEKLGEDVKETGSTTFSVSDDKIYLGFEEYAKDRIRGFYFENPREVKVAGFPATLYEMKFEKLTNVPQRWIACAYRVPGGEFAVMFSCTEQHFTDMRNDYNRTFASFKMLDSAGLKAPELRDSIRVLDEDEDDLSPEALLEKRKEQRAQAFARCIESLPAGWRTFESDNFLVAYADDPRYARQVGKQAEAVVSWLDERFGEVGSGHVQAMIVRVYPKQEDVPEVRGYSLWRQKGAVREISFGKSTQKGWTSEYNYLNRSILENWFRNKNDELWSRLPSWLRVGLGEYIEDAEAKGSRLAFVPDEWEKDRMTDAKLAQKKFAGNEAMAPLRPLRLLMTLTDDVLFAGQNSWYAEAQCAAAVRYFLDGPGGNNKKTAVVLPHYLGHLYDLVAEVERELEQAKKERESAEATRSAMSDEERLKAEDEEYQKRRAQAYDKVAREILQGSFDKTFQDWSDQDWAALESSFGRYID